MESKSVRFLSCGHGIPAQCYSFTEGEKAHTSQGPPHYSTSECGYKTLEGLRVWHWRFKQSVTFFWRNSEMILDWLSSLQQLHNPICIDTHTRITHTHAPHTHQHFKKNKNTEPPQSSFCNAAESNELQWNVAFLLNSPFFVRKAEVFSAFFPHWLAWLYSVFWVLSTSSSTSHTGAAMLALERSLDFRRCRVHRLQWCPLTGTSRGTSRPEILWEHEICNGRDLIKVDSIAESNTKTLLWRQALIESFGSMQTNQS